VRIVFPRPEQTDEEETPLDADYGMRAEKDVAPLLSEAGARLAGTFNNAFGSKYGRRRDASRAAREEWGTLSDLDGARCSRAFLMCALDRGRGQQTTLKPPLKTIARQP
jgi:hypothetical protein